MDKHERVTRLVGNVVLANGEKRREILAILRREYGTGGNSIEHQILEGLAVRCNVRAAVLREMASSLDGDRQHIMGNMGWGKEETE